MKRPESVKVIGQPFPVQWVENDAGPLGNQYKLGHSNVSEQSIAIKVKQGEDQLRDTMLHELLHVCFNMVGGLPNERAQEQAILLLSPILLDVLRSNPDLVAWLTA